MITVLVVTLATVVVLTLVISLVIVSTGTILLRRITYIGQRLESELIEISRNTRKP